MEIFFKILVFFWVVLRILFVGAVVYFVYVEIKRLKNKGEE